MGGCDTLCYTDLVSSAELHFYSFFQGYLTCILPPYFTTILEIQLSQHQEVAKSSDFKFTISMWNQEMKLKVPLFTVPFNQDCC